MTTTTLRPNAVAENVSFTAVGAASIQLATSDNLDSSYAESGAIGLRLATGMTTVALPAGAVTKTVGGRVRGYVDFSSPANFRCGTWEVPAASGFVTLTATAGLSGLGSIANPANAATVVTPVTLTQAQIDGLVARVDTFDAGNRFHEFYVDLVYVLLPVTVVTPVSPDPLTATNVASIAWTNTFDADGGAQTRYQIRVFTAAQYGIGGFDPATSPASQDTGEVVSAALTRNTLALANSTTYRAYVRVAQTVNGALHWSAYAFDQFSIDYAPVGGQPVPQPMLGCAEEYTVIITARDLRTYAAQVDFSQLSWSRVLDEVSEASVTVPDIFGGLRCNIELGSAIVPWKFGLRIERNGELVWAGPIVSIERPVRDGMGADFVTISAADIMKWMSRRTIKNVLSFTDQDAGTMFKAVVDEATTLDNLFDLQCPVFNTGYVMTRDVIPLDFEYASEILEDLARSAVDYFVLGTDLVVQNQDPTGFPAGWYVMRDGSQEQLAPTPDPFGRYFFGLFTDEAWVARPGWVIDGEAQGNNIYVPGADSGEAGFRRFWTASDVDPLVGLLDYVDVNTLYRPQEGTPITAQAVFQERANSLLALRRDAPVIVSGGALGQNAPITVDRLFPGSLWAIDLADHGVSQLLSIQRLKRVDVDVSVGEAGINERVSPTFIPIGTDEADGN